MLSKSRSPCVVAITSYRWRTWPSCPNPINGQGQANNTANMLTFFRCWPSQAAGAGRSLADTLGEFLHRNIPVLSMTADICENSNRYRFSCSMHRACSGLSVTQLDAIVNLQVFTNLDTSKLFFEILHLCLQASFTVFGIVLKDVGSESQHMELNLLMTVKQVLPAPL